MQTRTEMIDELYKTIGTDSGVLDDPEVAYLVVHQNKVLGSNSVPGLKMDVDELPDGISAVVKVEEGTVIEKPIHLCFGVLPETGIQKILLNVDIGRNSRISLLAHCTFPNAVDVQHIMDAKIYVGAGADYSYFERHIHGEEGGVKVYPKAIVELEQGARFKTEFELLRGRVGLIDINYETTCKDYSVMEMIARVNGTGDDVIKINEVGHLVGEGARGALTSRIAVRDRAKAEVRNTLTATAPFARGHVDCKEIVQDEGIATAIPVVDVRHPKAHVTHEAAIGSVDNKQLETLMARGLTEDEAVEVIIQGLLS
ncbi:MAG: SufD family Fe-S cluster assembly protein [Candidatus Eremiobacteraeota bacterium]|nr:SufD family Fe-S cluster assembly protein [Candidatus Eremiobacteraeota bacterium]